MKQKFGMFALGVLLFAAPVFAADAPDPEHAAKPEKPEYRIVVIKDRIWLIPDNNPGTPIERIHR
jgi:hypothetical protein